MLLLPLVVLLVKRMEGQPPEAMLAMKSPFLGASQTLTLEVSDKKSGIQEVWVALFKDGKEVVLLKEEFSAANILRYRAPRDLP